MVEKFWIIQGSGAQGWITLLDNFKAEYELCTEEEARGKTGEENALCVDTVEYALTFRDSLPKPRVTVLAYMPTHPTDEVLIDMGTHFSSRLLTTLMA